MPGMFAMTATFSVIVTMNKVAADAVRRYQRAGR